MRYEWDSKKAAGNLKKHGISFEEAGSVFNDPLAYTFPDPDHSDRERRFLTFGLSISQRILVVVHAEYELGIRIISARRATSHERKIYQES